MGQAEKNPTPANKHRDIVVKFTEAYEQAIVEAEVSREHTATEGWRKLYTDHRRASEANRRGIAKNLRQLADIIEQVGSTEDTEKEIGEAKKEANAARVADESFEAQVVYPVRNCVHNCEAVIDTYVSAARREEAESPLHNTGLEYVMRDAISKQPRASWDAETGMVTITPPK